jgi:DNA-binding MarR family transcriptional regulator
MVGQNPEVGDIQLLREIYLSPDPIVTAKEIAERTDYTRQAIRYRFNKLIEKGYLEKREVGSRAVVYWLSDEGEQQIIEG